VLVAHPSSSTFGSAALLLTGLSVGILFSVGCSSSSSPLPPAAPSNPLAECPASPNCERISKTYPVPASRLYDATNTALDTLGPADLQIIPDAMRASAVYRVAWIFKDDVDVAVAPQSKGSILHVRSASRVGQSDLGVNRRRVQRVLTAIDDHLSAPESARE